jgi:hypothetical protein
MRTEAELTDMFDRVGKILAKDSDDEEANMVYETLKWFNGYDYESTIGPYLDEV